MNRMAYVYYHNGLLIKLSYDLISDQMKRILI